MFSRPSQTKLWRGPRPGYSGYCTAGLKSRSPGEAKENKLHKLKKTRWVKYGEIQVTCAVVRNSWDKNTANSLLPNIANDSQLVAKSTKLQGHEPAWAGQDWELIKRYPFTWPSLHFCQMAIGLQLFGMANFWLICRPAMIHWRQTLLNVNAKDSWCFCWEINDIKQTNTTIHYSSCASCSLL